MPSAPPGGDLKDTRVTGQRHQNRWPVTVVLFMAASFAESLAWGHFTAFTPIYLRQLHVQANQVATWTGLMAGLGLVGLPLLPFWGAWAERYGRKPVIVRSSVVEAVLFAVAAVAQNPWELALARMLSALSMGNTGVMLAVQSEITPAKRTGLAIALVASGSSVAAAVGPLIGGFIAAGPGLRVLFWIDSAASAAGALLLMLFLKEEPRVKSTARTGQLALGAMRDVASTPAVRQLFMVFFLFAVGIGVVTPFLPLWVGVAYRHAHLSTPLPVVIGLVFGVAGAALAIGTPLLGWLGDRMGALASLRISLVGNALGMVGQAWMALIDLIAVSRTAQGLFQGGVSANIMTLLAKVSPPDRRSSIMNLSILPMQLSWFAGPLLGTALVGAWGLQPMLWVAAGLTAAGAVLAWTGLSRVGHAATIDSPGVSQRAVP
jgi:DHA1 family multidrug resistance protein-like MFS transporter